MQGFLGLAIQHKYFFPPFSSFVFAQVGTKWCLVQNHRFQGPTIHAKCHLFIGKLVLFTSQYFLPCSSTHVKVFVGCNFVQTLLPKGHSEMPLLKVYKTITN